MATADVTATEFTGGNCIDQKVSLGTKLCKHWEKEVINVWCQLLEWGSQEVSKVKGASGESLGDSGLGV